MRNSDGFTLLELMAVFAVIAMVVAVAAPRLLPMAVHFGHEGAARELAAYGEAAIQHAKLNNEELFVRFDLEKGQYWVEHWVPEDPDAEAEEDQPPALDAVTLQESMAATSGDPSATDEEVEESAEMMGNHFANFAEQRLRAQAELVEVIRKRDDDDRDAERDDENQENKQRTRPRDRDRPMVKEPLVAPFLDKRRMPEGVTLRSVTLPGIEFDSDKVEVVVSPLGIDRDVRMQLVSEDGDVLEVRWDPILGRGFVYSGDRDK